MNLFPVHDQEFLKKLGPDWYAKSFAAQPIGKFDHIGPVKQTFQSKYAIFSLSIILNIRFGCSKYLSH